MCLNTLMGVSPYLSTYLRRAYYRQWENAQYVSLQSSPSQVQVPVPTQPISSAVSFAANSGAVFPSATMPPQAVGVPVALFDPRWQPLHPQVSSGLQLGAGVGFGAGAAGCVGVQPKWASPPSLHVPSLSAPDPLAPASAGHEPNFGFLMSGNGVSPFCDTIGGASAGDFSPPFLSSTSASTAAWPAASLANMTRILPYQDGSASASKDAAESANAAKRMRGEQHQQQKTVGQKQAPTPFSYTSSKVGVPEMPFDAYCPMFSLFAPATAPSLVAPVATGAHMFPNVNAGSTGAMSAVLVPVQVQGASALAESANQNTRMQPTNECAMFKFNESGGASGAPERTSLRTDVASASCSSLAGLLRKSYRHQESRGPAGDARDEMEGHELHQKTASAIASGDEFQVEKMASTIEGEQRRNRNMPFEMFRPGLIRARCELYRTHLEEI